MIRVTQKYEDESLNSLLKRFKRRCEKEGLMQDMKRKEFYQKPSEKRHLRNKSRRG